MTRSAGDAVIPHSRPGTWRSAGSSVRTPEPVRTACTGPGTPGPAGSLQVGVSLGYPSGLASPTDTQDRGRKPSLSPLGLDYYSPTTHATLTLSGSGVPGSGGVGTPAAAAAAAAEGPSPAAQQLHSLQPHATVRDLTLSRVVLLLHPA